MAKNAHDFVNEANAKLESLGVGTYDDGSAWCYYQVCEDGHVWACDFNESISVDWKNETDEDIENFANAY